MTRFHVRPDNPLFGRVDHALYVSIAAGIVASGYLPLALQSGFVRSPVGILWPASVALSLAFVTVSCLRDMKPAGVATTALLALTGLFSVALITLNLLPPIARDELTYHLALPAQYLRAGRVYEIPLSDSGYFPMLVSMLYTPLLAHGAEIATKYLHMAFALASSALVYAYLRSRVRPWVAIFAATMLLTTPTVAVLSASAYVDLGLLFYATVAMVALLRWSETGRTPLLLLAALGAGCAASVKYNGLLVILLLGVAVILLCPPRNNNRRTIGLALLFGVVSLLPVLPWLLKNEIQTGNPVYPLLSGIFGGRSPSTGSSLDVISYRRLIYDETWLEIFLAPLRIFVTGREGDPARFDGVFNPFYLLGFLAPFLPSASRRDRVLASFAASFLLLAFFLFVFRSRYVVPALIPLLFLSAEVLDRSLDGGRRRAWAIAAAAALMFNLFHFATFWNRIDPVPYLAGLQTKSEFISRFVPEYPVTEYANEFLTSDARVHLAFLGNRAYYWRVPYTHDAGYSDTTLHQAVQKTDSAAGAAATLAALGITHLASADHLLERFMQDNLDPIEHARWREFRSRHLHPLYQQGGVGLYEIIG